jgi:putative alpha-1,2-mannosidase
MSLYSDKPDGLCGNEDCGQMSAWFVFSALGFYPANPANGAFVFGSPLFDEVTIQLPAGKQFTVKALNNSEKNCFILTAKLNGRPYPYTFITYKEIMQGGSLEFEMGPQPNKQFGADPKYRPTSKVYN